MCKYITIATVTPVNNIERFTTLIGTQTDAPLPITVDPPITPPIMRDAVTTFYHAIKNDKSLLGAVPLNKISATTLYNIACDYWDRNGITQVSATIFGRDLKRLPNVRYWRSNGMYYDLSKL